MLWCSTQKYTAHFKWNGWYVKFGPQKGLSFWVKLKECLPLVEGYWDMDVLKSGVLYINNLISLNRIYCRFESGDNFLLKSNRIRTFNTTCKTGKTLYIIHFQFYLSRRSNYLNWTKFCVLSSVMEWRWGKWSISL